jgi:hypothetical protein
MADSKTKRSKADDGVLASLPATRPTRLSRRGRANGDGDGNGDGGATATATTATATTPPKAKAKPRAAARPKAPAKPRPAPAAAAARPQRPRAVSAGAPTLSEPSLKAEENREPETSRSPSGKEVVTTVVQAAGELAQIGLTVSGQLLKRAVERLPRR